jgi:hypothetical protein
MVEVGTAMESNGIELNSIKIKPTILLQGTSTNQTFWRRTSWVHSNGGYERLHVVVCLLDQMREIPRLYARMDS